MNIPPVQPADDLMCGIGLIDRHLDVKRSR